MYSYGQVLPNDIDMVLTAFSENKWQPFKYEDGCALSSAIKQKPLAYLNKVNYKIYTYNENLNEYILLGKNGDANDYCNLLEAYGIYITTEQIKKFYGI